MFQYYDRSFYSPSSAVYGQYLLNPQPLVAETFGAVSLPLVSFAPLVGYGGGLVWGAAVQRYF
jgi:hypothetical protein